MPESRKLLRPRSALRDRVFSSHDVSERLKGKIYSGGVLAVLPHSRFRVTRAGDFALSPRSLIANFLSPFPGGGTGFSN